jgi:hypothetical protein
VAEGVKRRKGREKKRTSLFALNRRDSSRKKRAMAQGTSAAQADAFARSEREDSSSIEARVMDLRRRGVDTM